MTNQRDASLRFFYVCYNVQHTDGWHADASVVTCYDRFRLADVHRYFWIKHKLCIRIEHWAEITEEDSDQWVELQSGIMESLDKKKRKGPELAVIHGDKPQKTCPEKDCYHRAELDHWHFMCGFHGFNAGVEGDPRCHSCDRSTWKK